MKLFGNIALNLFFQVVGLTLCIMLVISYLSQINSGEQILLFDSPLKYQCAYKIKTGQDCGSCGLSRSWSSVAKLNISQGKKYNSSGPLTFYAAHLYVLGFFYINLKNAQIKRIWRNNNLLKLILLIILILSWSNIITTNIERGVFAL